MNPKGTRKTSILVVDDDVELLDMLEIALRDAGYQTDRACDGKEAMNVASRKKFDLVITDILMEPRDGFELIRDLRRLKLGWPIIAISGGAMIDGNSYLEIARAYGVRGVLAKPLTPAQLLSSVSEALTLN